MPSLQSRRWPMQRTQAGRALLPRLARHLLVCGVVLLPPHTAVADDPEFSFDRHIRPILARACLSCHGPDEAQREADLRLDSRASCLAVRESGRAAVAPGSPERSLLWLRVTSTDPELRMPPAESQHRLRRAEIEQLRRWIEAGAPWSRHWAFTSVREQRVPNVQRVDWPRSAIDFFVLSALEKQGMSPSPPADRRTLIRRVTFDLTGLPPTPEDVRAFLNDSRPDAYERVVERLLASPRYGERFATVWLDAARYADTNGYFMDNGRDMWAWRDWVVRALNANMPFDRFTIEQLAGDLLPDATLDQRLASGFHRNHGINFEAGALDAECRTEYVVDRVNTTGTVWLGLTLGCARCHDHPYDPISQEEYYRLFAFFNNVDESGVAGHWGNAEPMVALPANDQAERLAALERELRDVETRLAALGGGAVHAIAHEQEQIAAGATIVPVAEYRFDAGDGYEVENTKGPDAEIDGRAEWARGLFGNALAFHGDVSVDCGDVLEVDAEHAFACSALVFPARPTAGTLLAQMGEQDGPRGFEVAIERNQLVVRLVHKQDDAIVVSSIGRSRTRPLAGRWAHLAVAYDGSGRAAGVRVWIDGRRVPIHPLQDNLTGSIAGGVSFRIGRRETGRAFHGMIDEVRLYDRCLPDDFARRAGSILQGLVGDSLRLWNRRTALDFAHRRERLSVPTAMVMRERPSVRETHVLLRGDYDRPGKRVAADTPAFLPPMPNGVPSNRLGLARWLVDPSHPLTARVAMNRAWQLFFGKGLVATPEDFGVQGDRPTHPRLLDWLAAEFVRRQWDVKAMHRLIVTSATYRQQSVLSPALLQQDPGNRWLARMARRPLTAEMLRDAALAYGGLLRTTPGGPGVFPYQPPGLWKANSFRDGYTAQEFVQSHGADLYRRSLYTFWKRTCPPPNMSILGAPSREFCVVRRNSANTPIQALVLLNDPTFVEAARGVAERLLLECPDDAQRLTHAFELVLGRPPKETERRIVHALFASERRRFAADPARAVRLRQVGESPARPGVRSVELAAWTVVASALMSLDEALTRN